MIARFFSLIIILLFIACDEEYVNSLNSTNPKISMELVTNLDDNYLGESVENIEILVKVKDSPSISSLAFSVNYQPAFFSSDSIIVSPLSDNLFYNISSNLETNNFFAHTDSTFEVNLGFTNNQDTTYTYGDGDVVSLFLSGKNVQTNLNLSLDDVLNYNSSVSIDEWTKENINIGKPIPQVFASDFAMDFDNNILSFDINTVDLPDLTDSQLKIIYDQNLFSYINENSPEVGSLLNQGFNLTLDSSVDGEILFSFTQSDGNDDKYISGGGTLVKLKFNVTSQNIENEQLNFEIYFTDSVYDVCGECNNPDYSERFEFDISFWGNYKFSGNLLGCKNQEAINYFENSLINFDSLCEYE